MLAAPGTNREPMTTSYPSWAFASMPGISAGSCEKSASSMQANVPRAAWVAWKTALARPCLPFLESSRTRGSVEAKAATSSAVPSGLLSSTTMTSEGVQSSAPRIARASGTIVTRSLRVGMTNRDKRR